MGDGESSKLADVGSSPTAPAIIKTFLYNYMQGNKNENLIKNIDYPSE